MADPDAKYTVLIVDDAPDNIQVISAILYPQGVNISIAQNGREALDMIARKPPDLILLDVIMPEMDGFAVCTHLQQDPTIRDLPIIFLTARTQSDDIVKGFECGAVDYITRPFNPAELRSRVFTHLELKRSRDLIAAQNQQLTQQNSELQALYALKEQYFADALRRSEQQYRLLVENVADGIGIVQEGKLAFVNDAMAAMLGYTSAQLVGKSPANLLPHDYNTQLAQGLAESQSWPILQCIVTGDNREVWMEGYQSVITWEGKPAILTGMRDITKRKLREMAIEDERDQLRRENLTLRSTIKERYRFGDILGKSQAMQAMYELIIKASASEQNVLIYGESGAGKELVARTIHQLSQRQNKAFVPVNCGAVPETLFEREFFGHRKGAFTGADRDKQGLFDAAHQGTLFLDEIGELTPAMQVKLLRAIEAGGYTPIGATESRKVDVRIIAATNRNLTEQVEQGRMREDFFYRIHVIVITAPPLRERREDIPLLIDHFVRQYGGGKALPAISGKILETLYNCDWPGNIRQLQNVLSRYLTVGQLDLSGPRHLEAGEPEAGIDREVEPEGAGLQEAVEHFEKQVITRTLEQQRWHRGKTAESLRIDPKTLYRKMKQYQLI